MAAIPFRLVLAVLLVVWVADWVAGFVTRRLPGMPAWAGGLCHGAVLAGLVLPALYSFVFRPWKRTLDQQQRARDAVRESERKRAEGRLAELAALLDAANDAILVQDLSHRVLFWNKAAERLYGWTAVEALNQATTDLHEADTAQAAQARERVLAQGDWAGEVRQVSQTGKPITVFSRWTLVRDEKGAPKSIFVISSDITERKKLEGQLLRAQRLESIGQLADGLAHDLKNILVPISMVSPLLREQVESPEARSLVDELDASAQRGARLVEQIQTFSRGVDSAKAPMQTRVVLEEVSNVVRETFPRSIRLEANLQQDLWLVAGDPTQLRQALLNLCVNAREAMPEGGVLTLGAENVLLDEVFASLAPHARPGPYVVCLVADTGTGIPAENLERIFDPFFTTKTGGQGAGLGLSTVLGIIRSHDGFVRVESTVGRGTQVRVYLPAVEESVVMPSSATEPAPDGKGELILLVDDEESIRSVTERYLERHGYRVLTARDGTEAIALFSDHRTEIGAVLTDLWMPQMDGMTLIRILQTTAPQTKILIATGQDPKSLSAVTERGIQSILVKPYTPNALLQALHSVIEGGPKAV